MLIERSSKDLSRSIYLAIPQLSVRIRAMSYIKTTPKRFAPLDPQKSNTAGAPTLKGIVFDVDGTLWYAFFNHDFLYLHRDAISKILRYHCVSNPLYHAIKVFKANLFTIINTRELHNVQ